MPYIKIEAVDTLFFKDGRPFSMGEDTFATGIFPPPPSVFLGMLKSAYASENNTPLDKIKEETEHIKIEGVYYSADKIYFPIPLDLVKLKSSINTEAVPLCLSLKYGFASKSTDFSHILWHSKHIETISNGMLSQDMFEEYLNDEKPIGAAFSYQRIDNLTTTEVKVGIGRNKENKQSEDGKLYRIGMRRMQNQSKDSRFSFIIKTNENLLTAHGKLGAEGKGIHFYHDIDFRPISDIEYQENQYFKLYLQTPGFFKNGSIPNLKEYFPSWDLEILAGVVGRPLHIGGFDMTEKGGPKTMMKAVPAGSVYYVKIHNGTTKDFVNSLPSSLHSISDFRQDEGFGIYLIGNLNINKYLKSILKYD